MKISNSSRRAHFPPLSATKTATISHPVLLVGPPPPPFLQKSTCRLEVGGVNYSLCNFVLTFPGTSEPSATTPSADSSLCAWCIACCVAALSRAITKKFLRKDRAPSYYVILISLHNIVAWRFFFSPCCSAIAVGGNHVNQLVVCSRTLAGLQTSSILRLNAPGNPFSQVELIRSPLQQLIAAP